MLRRIVVGPRLHMFRMLRRHGLGWVGWGGGGKVKTFLARAHMVDAAQDCCWSTFAHVLHLKSQGVVPLKFLSPCFCVWDIAFGPRIPFLCSFFQTVCFLWSALLSFSTFLLLCTFQLPVFCNQRSHPLGQGMSTCLNPMASGTHTEHCGLRRPLPRLVMFDLEYKQVCLLHERPLRMIVSIKSSSLRWDHIIWLQHSAHQRSAQAAVSDELVVVDRVDEVMVLVFVTLVVVVNVSLLVLVDVIVRLVKDVVVVLAVVLEVVVEVLVPLVDAVVVVDVVFVTETVLVLVAVFVVLLLELELVLERVVVVGLVVVVLELVLVELALLVGLVLVELMLVEVVVAELVLLVELVLVLEPVVLLVLDSVVLLVLELVLVELVLVELVLVELVLVELVLVELVLVVLLLELIVVALVLELVLVVLVLVAVMVYAEATSTWKESSKAT